MALSTVFLISSIISIWISTITAQSVSSPSLPPTPSPSPAPQPVNLTDLLSLTGPYKTFLNLLIVTETIQTFQNQANNTKQGITIFVPSDSAFAEIEKPSLSNLPKNKLKSLALYHAFPKFYSLSDFKDLSSHNPVSTLAGGKYALNLTDTSGLIQVGSDWTNPKITSSVYSTYPIAVYAMDSVLLPKDIVSEAPTITPPPISPPDISPSSGLGPAGGKGDGGSPKSSESGSNNGSSSSHAIAESIVISFLAGLLVSFLLML